MKHQTNNLYWNQWFEPKIYYNYWLSDNNLCNNHIPEYIQKYCKKFQSLAYHILKEHYCYKSGVNILIHNHNLWLKLCNKQINVWEYLNKIRKKIDIWYKKIDEKDIIIKEKMRRLYGIIDECKSEYKLKNRLEI